MYISQYVLPTEPTDQMRGSRPAFSMLGGRAHFRVVTRKGARPRSVEPKRCCNLRHIRRTSESESVMYISQYVLPTEPTDHMLSDLSCARFDNANRRSVMYISQYVLPTEPCDHVQYDIIPAQSAFVNPLFPRRQKEPAAGMRRGGGVTSCAARGCGGWWRRAERPAS